MKIPGSFVKNINLLNFSLLAGSAILVAAAVIPMTATVRVQVTPPEMKRMVADDPAASAFQIPAYTDYVMISGQNVFHPSRKMPPEKKGEHLIVRPELLLYGTVITETMKVAYVEDRKAPPALPGRRKKQMVLREGGALNNYVLQKIEKDRIEMVRGDDRIVFHLSDPDKERSGETSRSATAPERAKPEVPVKPNPAPPAPKYPTRYGR